MLGSVVRSSETVAADVALVASAIGEPTRAAILDALMDGTARRATDLAARAGVAPSTASGHLARLLAVGLVVCERAGRERRFRLGSPAVADAIEALARVAPPLEPRSLRSAERSAALRNAARARQRAFARACLDWTERRPHLAGALGAALADALVSHRWVEPRPRDRGLRVTGVGLRELDRLGVELDPA